jgi:hypothetical protein
VLAPFDAAQAWYPGRSTKGCSAVNARAEEGPDSDGLVVAEEVAEQKRWMTAVFAELCAEADFTEAEVLGKQLQLLLDGALVTLGTRAFEEPLLVARDAARRLLRIAT